MKEIIKYNVIDIEPGYLYFVDRHGNIGRARMQRRNKKLEETL